MRRARPERFAIQARSLAATEGALGSIEEPPISLRLDAEGRFWHDGTRVAHARLAALLHRSIARRDDGSLVVTTGRDAVPLEVEDAPFFVITITDDEDALWLELSDGTREPLAPGARLVVDERDRLRVRVKGDRFWALVRRTAHGALLDRVDDDGRAVRVPGGVVAIGDAPPGVDWTG